MQKTRPPSLQTLFIYLCGFTLVMGWWWIGLNREKKEILLSGRDRVKGEFRTIDRELLIEGLRGNVEVMVRLINEWEGEYIDLKRGYKNSSVFYPQTYAAACFMLALCDPEQIVSLPRGIRNYEVLFPKELTNKIIHDTNKYSMELLSLKKPVAAFISSYSDPNVVQALKQQGVGLVILGDGNGFDAIMKSIRVVGEGVGEKERSDLMLRFMQAALRELDRKKDWLRESGQMPRFLCAYDNGGLQLPTKKTLTGQILERMGVGVIEGNGWTIPLSNEMIQKENPEIMIIATEEKKESTKDRRYIPYHVQLSPTQFSVLAYYDILEALCL